MMVLCKIKRKFIRMQNTTTKRFVLIASRSDDRRNL
jgi:hypothetical protein